MKKRNHRKIKRKHFWDNRAKKLLLRRSTNRKRTALKLINNTGSFINSYSRFNDLITFLAKSEFAIFRRLAFYDKKAFLKVPRKFSFSENTDETIEFLQKLLSVNNYKASGIFFDHSECEYLGIGASAVMDAILLNIDRDNAVRKRHMTFGGRLLKDSENPEDRKDVMEMLLLSGVLHNLGVTKVNPDPKKFKTLSLIRVEKDTKNKDYPGIIATRVVQYFNECLLTKGYELSDNGNNYFGLMISEVLDNCQSHSGEFCQWYVQGHYTSENRENVGECHLVIFNFGQSIYESLKQPITSSDLICSLDNITDIHKKRGFFDIGRNWDEETLWTLYALQEGVSRCYSKVRDFSKDIGPDRGVGTINLIRSFQSVGDSKGANKPVMSIISGNVGIYFKKDYQMKKMKLDTGEEKDIIAFNETNDLKLPPDSECVKRLKNYFPGTIISMKFYLDQDVLKEKIGSVKNDN